MKDWFLIPAVAAQFVFGYYVMGKIGAFMEENRRLRRKKRRRYGTKQIRHAKKHAG